MERAEADEAKAARRAHAPREIYLDWSATAPLHESVLHALTEAAKHAWGNPSSVHEAGRRARSVVEQTRELVAETLGVEPRDVLFTAGATEANNLALAGASCLVTSRVEHPSVVRVGEALERQGRAVVWLPVDAEGRVLPAAVEAALSTLPRGATVAVAAANHETGVVHPIQEISTITSGYGASLHVDLAQAAGKLDARLWRGAQSLSLSAHKLGGPKGIGALGFRPPFAPMPVLLGGAQERGFRPGTSDAVAGAGLGAALRRLDEMRERFAALLPLRDRLERALLPFAIPNGKGARLPHVSNLSFSGWSGDELVAALDLEGVRVSSGSACSAGTTEPSSVIAAFAGSERARGAVRFSLGESTTPADIERVIELLLGILRGRRA